MDEGGRELTGLKWSLYSASELTQFDAPLAAVSEDQMNYHFNEDCACDPRPYYPCPGRFLMSKVKKASWKT